MRTGLCLSLAPPGLLTVAPVDTAVGRRARGPSAYLADLRLGIDLRDTPYWDAIQSALVYMHRVTLLRVLGPHWRSCPPSSRGRSRGATPLPQVAVGHALGGVGVGHETQFGGADQQWMAGHHAYRVAEGTRPAQPRLPRVADDAFGGRRAVCHERAGLGLDDVLLLVHPPADGLDGDVLRRQFAQGHARPDRQPLPRAPLTVGRLDVLDPDGRPGRGDPLLPRGQVARRG